MKLRWQWIVLQTFALCAFIFGLSATIATRVRTWNIGGDPFFPLSLLIIALMLAGLFVFILGFTDGEAYCYYEYLSERDKDVELKEYRNKTIIVYKGWVSEPFFPKKENPSLSGRVIKLARYYNIRKKKVRTEIISYE